MTKIISICNEKGGVGKTTTTFNIAAAFVTLGKKVLIIDLDQQGNCSSYLGYKRDGKPTICELIYNTVAEQETVIEDTIRTSLDGIDYVPASPMLTNITSIISNDSDSNYVLKRAITNPLYNKYDYILIDCRTTLDLLVANAMNASTHVVIPCEAKKFAYDGLDKMLNKCKSINSSTNPTLKVGGILITKEERTNMSKAVKEAITGEYTKLVFNTSIPYNPAQADNSSYEQKSYVNNKNSSLGQAYMKVTKELMERCDNYAN